MSYIEFGGQDADVPPGCCECVCTRRQSCPDKAEWRISVGCVHEHITIKKICQYCHDFVVSYTDWICVHCGASIQITWEKLLTVFPR